MPQLSASTLKLFQECPRCFWLHVNQKIERPRGPFPSLPSGIDRVLKGYFDGYRRRGMLPPLIDGKLEGVLAENELTLGFNDARAHARLWGKLDDCVMLPDRRLAPLDHKTRASAPDGPGYTEKYYQFQMDVYTLLLERNGHPTSRTAYVVYYFPVDGELHRGFPFELAVHHIRTDPERAYEIFLAGSRCLAGERPGPGPACGFCRWAEARALGPDPAAEPLRARPAGTFVRAVPRRQTRAVPAFQAASRSAGTFPEDLFGT